MSVTTSLPAISEQQIVDYALDPANQERFAELLAKILPAYTTWVWGQDNIYRRYFNRWQQAGFNLTPNHYYNPIPYAAHLSPKVLDARSEMVGIDWREKEQLRFLSEVCGRFRPEYEQFPERATKVPHQFFLLNGAFGTVDAEVLHTMIRHYQPRRVIEIGSGCSTLVTAAALEMNRRQNGRESRFTAIEPYPVLESHSPAPSNLDSTRRSRTSYGDATPRGRAGPVVRSASQRSRSFLLRLGDKLPYHFITSAASSKFQSIGPAQTVLTGCASNKNEVTIPKFPPPPRTAREQIGILLGVRDYEASVRQHHIDREQVVDSQPVFSSQVAHSAERKAGDPSARYYARRHRQAEGVRRMVHIAPRATRAH